MARSDVRLAAEKVATWNRFHWAVSDANRGIGGIIGDAKSNELGWWKPTDDSQRSLDSSSFSNLPPPTPTTTSLQKEEEEEELSSDVLVETPRERGIIEILSGWVSILLGSFSIWLEFLFWEESTSDGSWWLPRNALKLGGEGRRREAGEWAVGGCGNVFDSSSDWCHVAVAFLESILSEAGDVSLDRLADLHRNHQLHSHGQQFLSNWGYLIEFTWGSYRTSVASSLFFSLFPPPPPSIKQKKDQKTSHESKEI